MLKDDIKKQIETSCATYAGNGQCHLDHSCPFFNGELGEQLPRCLYYETSVLPADDKLQARYWNSFGLAHWGSKQDICKRCENPYKRKSNRVPYCETCNEIVKRETRRKRNQRYQRNQRKGKTI